MKLITRQTMTLERIGSAFNGIRLYAAKGDKVLHVVARREKPKNTTNPPSSAHDFRMINATSQPLMVELPDGGTDATQCGFAHLTLKAAETLSADGIEVEVIDLRTLLPLDTPTVLESVSKTGKAVIVHEAPKVGGIGGEIAAVLAEECFWELDAPIRRLTGFNTSFPAAKTMEDYYMPGVDEIERALRETAET